VGIDETVSAAGIAKVTFCRHFPSKEAPVLAFPQRRDEALGIEIVLAEVRQGTGTPEEGLLAIFDVFDEWFACPDCGACSCIRVLFYMGGENTAGRPGSGTWPRSVSRLSCSPGK
jgi:AcrR family transcriptional regulator